MAGIVKGILSEETRKKIFMTAFIVYVAELVVFTSMYAKVEPLGRVFALIRVTAYALVCLKLLLDFLAGKFSLKEIGVVGLISLLLLWTTYKTGRKAILIYWAFIVAAHDVEFDKIIKWSCLTHLGALLFVFASRYGGIIENRVYASSERVRDSIGFQFTTEGPNFFFYTILMWIYWKKEKITWTELAALAGGNFFLFYKTNTKSAFTMGCIALVLAVILKKSSYLRKYHRLYGLAAVGCVPLLAYGIFKLSVEFTDRIKWLNELNELLTGRLLLGRKGYRNYGVQLWGQRIEWIGGTNKFEETVKTYNYVDSSFMQILLNCGLVFLLFLVVIFMILGIKTAIKKDTYFLVALLIFALHSTFDPQIIWMEFNSFVMLYSYFFWKGEKSPYMSWLWRDFRRYKILAGIFILLCTLTVGQMGGRKAAELQARAERQQQKVETYETSLLEYDREEEDVRQAITLTKQQISRLQDYIDNSIYMKLDGKNIYVADTQYQIETSANSGNILNSLIFYINEGGLQGDIAAQYGAETGKYLREISACYGRDNNVLVVYVTHRSEQEAQETLSVVKEMVGKQIPVIAGVQGEFSLAEISASAYTKEDANVTNTQKSHRDNLENYKKSCSDLEDKLAGIQENRESYEERNQPDGPWVTVSGTAAQTLQYGGVGMIMGIAIVCIWFMLGYLLSGSLWIKPSAAFEGE